MSKAAEKIEIRNIISPGHVVRVDKAKYSAMRDALLQVLPAASPGLTVAEAKAAQLDLEAQGVIQREATKPLRLYRAQ